MFEHDPAVDIWEDAERIAAHGTSVPALRSSRPAPDLAAAFLSATGRPLSSYEAPHGDHTLDGDDVPEVER